MAGQSKSDVQMLSRNRCPLYFFVHVIIFQTAIFTKFDKNMTGGQVIFFFIKTGIIFNEIMVSLKTIHLGTF